MNFYKKMQSYILIFTALILPLGILSSDSIWTFISQHIPNGQFFVLILVHYIILMSFSLGESRILSYVRYVILYLCAFAWVYIAVRCCYSVHSFIGIYSLAPPRLCLIAFLEMILLFIIAESERAVLVHLRQDKSVEKEKDDVKSNR